MMTSRPVRILNADVARKIAAGEVIDRPAATVRELMDNAVDSGADSVTVEIEGGGIDRIRVVDNGCGMTKEDLAICAHPHATSKISTETDLMNLSTLGFRGEALSSIAAVSYLSITSGTWHMRASITEDHLLDPSQPVEGTIVESRALFENFPARRRFLKRPASESLLCKNTFIEKTLPFPDISFKLSIDGKQKFNLKKGQTLIQRFVQALALSEPQALFYELEGSSEGFRQENETDKKAEWSYRLVIGEPAVYRNDRKQLYIYVNGRRLTEYALMQAVEYGGQGYFPNGTHPVAALFVTMDPSLVDFNIHPAKKEARFKDISDLHHNISSTIRKFLKDYTITTVNPEKKPAETTLFVSDSGAEFNYETKTTAAGPQISAGETGDLRSQFFGSGNGKDFPRIKTVSGYDSPVKKEVSELAAEAAEEDKIRYIGRALGVFLIAEKGQSLYLIDQHAAHERILYNSIMENNGHAQKLLVPYVVETMSEADDRYLESLMGKLKKAGYTAKNCGDGRWEFSSLPERWQGTENDLAHALLDKHLDPEELLSSLAATAACKAAIKDGGILDDTTAEQLVRETMNLPDPHCPHGRPVFTVITRDELFRMVRRT